MRRRWGSVCGGPRDDVRGGSHSICALRVFLMEYERGRGGGGRGGGGDKGWKIRNDKVVVVVVVSLLLLLLLRFFFGR